MTTKHNATKKLQVFCSTFFLAYKASSNVRFTGWQEDKELKSCKNEIIRKGLSVYAKRKGPNHMLVRTGSVE